MAVSAMSLKEKAEFRHNLIPVSQFYDSRIMQIK